MSAKMFPNLRAELARKNLNLGNFAKIIGMAEPSINKKMNGRHEFKLDEMLNIKKCLGVDMPLDELFKKYDTSDNNPERENWQRTELLKSKTRKRRQGKYTQVEQCDKDGNYIKTWNSPLEADKALNINHNTIIEVCQKTYGRKTAGGFVWRWVYENIDEEQ